MAHIRSRSLILSKKAFWPIGLIIAMAVIFLVLEVTNTTYFFHHKKIPATIPVVMQNNKSVNKNTNPSQNSTSSQSSSQSNSDKLPSSTGNSTSASSPLIPPYGTFVSNHSPGQNGTSMVEQSVCYTTPGATCLIQFTNTDGNSTKLPTQTVGSDGSTTWSSWDASILTSGEWQIKAVANLNSQTRSVTDPTKLEIK